MSAFWVGLCCGVAVWSLVSSVRLAFWKGRAEHWASEATRLQREAKAAREDRIYRRLLRDIFATEDPLASPCPSHPLCHPIERATIEEVIGGGRNA